MAAWLGLDRDGFAGLDPPDREHPAALVLVGPAPLPDALPVPPAPGDGPWLGRANRLSPGHVRWDEIDDVAAATWGPATAPQPAPPGPPLPPLAAGPGRPRRDPDPAAPELPGARRPDGPRRRRLLPHARPPAAAAGRAPWDLLPWRPLVHAFVFVHRVRGLEPGLYLFERAPEAHAACGPRARRRFAGGGPRAARTTWGCTCWPGATTGRRRGR